MCQNVSYDDATGLLAQISATTAATRSSTDPAASMRRNSRIGRATSRASGLLLAR